MLDRYRNMLRASVRALKAATRMPHEVRAVAGRLHNDLEKLKRDLRTIAGVIRKNEEMARQLRAEQASMRILLENAVVPGRAGLTLSTHPVPMSSAEIPVPPERRIDIPVQMMRIDACPLCGERERTLVCEYNKLILLDVDIAEAVKQYDYSLCHRCGVVYAAHRPCGETFVALYERFDDNLGRARDNQRRNLLLTPGPLSDDDRAVLEARLASGTLVSEHLEQAQRGHFPQLQRDRLAASVHVEVLGSLLPLDGAKVLEVRSRFGGLLASLRRIYGVEPFALPLTEAQQFIISRAHGIPAVSLIDFEDFRIPYDETFDLVVANHMLTHMLRPAAFLEEVRKHLKPGGHLYLYNESDEREFTTGKASMINTLNPFHMQTFDPDSLRRALAAHGFDTVFVMHQTDYIVTLASWTGTTAPPCMSPEQRTQRLALYQRARDSAILRLPEAERWRYRDQWDAIVGRAVVTGVAGFDEHARLHPLRRTPVEEDPEAGE